MNDDFIAEPDSTPIKQDMVADSIEVTDNISLQKVVDEISSNLDSKKPSSKFFIFSGKRQIEKQKLDIEYQQLLLDKIKLLGLTADERAKAKANIILSPNTVKAIVDDRLEDIIWNRAEFQKKIELADKQHADTLDVVDDRAMQRKLDIVSQEVDIRIKMADAGIKEEQRHILVAIKEALNFENPNIEQVLMLVKALNPDSKDSLQTLIEKGLADAKIEDIRAGAEMKRKQADEQDIKAKTAKYNLIQSIKEDKEYE